MAVRLVAPASWRAGKSEGIHRFAFDGRPVSRVPFQSGDYADFIAAVQNLAGFLPSLRPLRSLWFDCRLDVYPRCYAMIPVTGSPSEILSGRLSIP